MEEHFIKDALKAPMLDIETRLMSDDDTAAISKLSEPAAVAREESQSSMTSQSGSSLNAESQSTASTAATSFSSITEKEKPTAGSMEPTSPSGPPEHVVQLLRLRTALSFLLSSYTPEHIRTNINSAVASSDVVDFAPLDAHLAHLTSLRRQAQALRSVSDNISRKRAMDDDDAVEARAEKKRKKEEEEKRKRAETRAIKDLKKADTSGMKKLSAFFTKAAAK